MTRTVSTADPSEGPGHRLGTIRDGCERQFDLRLEELLIDFQPVNNDDDCVIVQSAEHAARTLLSFRTCRIVDGGTQCMPLSAAVVNQRSAGRLPGLYSMLGVIGARRNLSLAFREVTAATSTAVQSARCVSHRFVYSSTILTPSAMARSPLAAARFGLTDSREVL